MAALTWDGKYSKDGKPVDETCSDPITEILGVCIVAGINERHHGDGFDFLAAISRQVKPPEKPLDIVCDATYYRFQCWQNLYECGKEDR